MKKIFKVLIALVLIAGLATGVYFLFFSKDNTKLVYQNVYNLNYNLKSGEKNIVVDINNAVLEMQDLIAVHSMQLDNVYNDLGMYYELFVNYSAVGDHILEFGGFVNKNIGEFANKANASYNKIVNIYNQSYDYLKETYFKVVDKASVANTVKDYIQNFYNIFKNLIPEFNTFYYNTCLAYAYGLENTMQYNNFYKLKVAYYAETVNQYYINTDNSILYNLEMVLVKADLNNDFSQKYFDNKSIYDELISKINSINTSELASKIAINKSNEILDAVETEEQRQVIQKYIDYVARG